jgi:hypothetical protein
MSVRDELSSDVATALLEMKGTLNARDLKDVLIMFRSTLRTLSAEENRRRRARLLPERPPEPKTGAAPPPAN